ncbi:rRNA biogenesis protein rrp36 [Spiromyces aspiralis]|uniref:rRNA biogenesis protein rrp36 n=1 Tax=Spiromyces aspiralis TaxID=68401 RepID=A0ACC1HAL3_9FUNG|nr:rRNA biogenesis protein rrp36 [Spiromyces aspiralis]
MRKSCYSYHVTYWTIIELADIPFEKLIELQNKLKTSQSSKGNLIKAGEQSQGKHSFKSVVKDPQATTKHKKRRSKKEPTIESSTRPVGRFRTVVEIPKTGSRDPRFDPMSGKFNEELFAKSYDFIKDYQKSEIEMLKKQIDKAKKSSPGEAENLKKLFSQLESRLKAQERKEHLKELARQHKKKEMKLVKNGKAPFFLKKSMLKEIELAEKFDKIKNSKQLDKLLEKRRKHNAAKEHKRIPFKRRRVEEAD